MFSVSGTDDNSDNKLNNDLNKNQKGSCVYVRDHDKTQELQELPRSGVKNGAKSGVRSLADVLDDEATKSWLTAEKRRKFPNSVNRLFLILNDPGLQHNQVE